jgi:hypothetical protein
METAGPATGPAFSFGQFRVSPFDTALAGLDQFGALYPANPFVTGEWCNVIPGSQRVFVTLERPLEV